MFIYIYIHIYIYIICIYIYVHVHAHIVQYSTYIYIYIYIICIYIYVHVHAHIVQYSTYLMIIILGLESIKRHCFSSCFERVQNWKQEKCVANTSSFWMCTAWVSPHCLRGSNAFAGSTRSCIQYFRLEIRADKMRHLMSCTNESLWCPCPSFLSMVRCSKR